jgi:copper chaperone CopZ
MHCNACAQKITQKLKLVDGVVDVTVDYASSAAAVKMDKHVSTTLLNEAIKVAGDYRLEDKVETTTAASRAPEEKQSLTPLLVIVAYLVGGVILHAQQTGDFSSHSLMRIFMGGFFVLFSLFKMVDLSGFADGYSTYDVLAKRSRVYAISYPFIELGLGILFFLNALPLFTNGTTAVLMAVGAIGVGKALLEKRAIQCACLGTALKLPMTKVTLAEDVIMGLMAIAALSTYL